MDMDQKAAIALAAKLLKISEEEAESCCHTIENVDALYFSVPQKGGDSLIVAASGEVLYANSSVGYDEHLKEFLKGTRTPLEAFGEK